MLAPPFPAAAIAAARDSAKLHLRVATDTEDALIERHAAAALSLCEAFIGQSLIVRGWSEIVPSAIRWQRLGGAPVTLIDGVEGLTDGGSGYPIPPEAYAIDVDSSGEGWLRSTTTWAAARLHVTYQAGLAAEWAGLPAPIAQGVVLLVAHGFDARTSAFAPPAAVTALWRPWRRTRLGGRAAA